MASSMMHLAIIEKLSHSINFKDINRLRIGSILPDACLKGNSHFKKTSDNLNMYDLELYRNKYLQKMKEDDLYLGYYLHLIQDAIHRRMVYHEYNWDSTIKENVNKLHNDYVILNNYVISKYMLDKNILKNIDISKESINDIGEFDLEKLVNDIKKQFDITNNDSIFFFTKEMTDTYINNAYKLCLSEIKNIYDEKECINNISLSYYKKQKL